MNQNSGYNRDEQEIGMAHEVESHENLNFSQIMIGQYQLGPEFDVKLCTDMDGLVIFQITTLSFFR